MSRINMSNLYNKVMENTQKKIAELDVEKEAAVYKDCEVISRHEYDDGSSMEIVCPLTKESLLWFTAGTDWFSPNEFFSEMEQVADSTPVFIAIKKDADGNSERSIMSACKNGFHLFNEDGTSINLKEKDGVINDPRLPIVEWVIYKSGNDVKYEDRNFAFNFMTIPRSLRKTALAVVKQEYNALTSPDTPEMVENPKLSIEKRERAERTARDRSLIGVENILGTPRRWEWEQKGNLLDDLKVFLEKKANLKESQEGPKFNM